MKRQAKAAVRPMRQSTQYNCMTASMTMCLQANGLPPEECSTEMVNAVMGARPMKGASWEQALACAQHYGMRGILMVPCTVKQLKEWTDQGVPVMIAWNPEGREWSHASVVYDVTVPGSDAESGLMVHVADPNIPNPDKTSRVMTEDEFYGKWFEKWPNYLVRRPALAIMREITPEGRQVMASNRTAVSWEHRQQMRDEYRNEQRRDRQRDKQWLLEQQRAEKKNAAFRKARLHYHIVAELDNIRPIQQWLKKIERAYTSSFESHTLDPRLVKLPRGVKAPSWKVYVGKVTPEEFDELADLKKRYPQLKGSDENIEPYQKRYAQKLFQEAGLDPSGKKIEDSGESEKIQILETLADKVKGWPEGLAHVEKVLEDYRRGRNPSLDDLKAIRNYLYKNRMRDEANHFRKAGEKRAQTPDEEDALRALGWTDNQIENMSEKRITVVLRKKIKSRGRQAKVDEKLMIRAALLLIYKGEKEAAKILMDDGISAEDAYLAVKAGAVMNHQPDKLIDKVVQRYASRVAYEVYVDSKGYGHDDEGNTWYVGKEYGEGTYGLHDLPRNTYGEPSTSDRPQYRRPGRAPKAPTRVNKEQLAAVDALVFARPRDRFLMSLREQVASGRVLSDKQKKALRQNFYRNGMKDKADLFR